MRGRTQGAVPRTLAAALSTLYCPEAYAGRGSLSKRDVLSAFTSDVNFCW